MLMGLFWLSTVPLTNGTVATMFGVKNISMLGGTVFFAHQLGSFLGGWLGLHADHLDDLSPPCDEFAARAGLRRGHRLDLRSNLFGE
jgi:hypothetical protein